MHLEIDSEARSRAIETDARPITFVPDVDFATLPDRCITDAF
jgi:hypothetical protein